MCAFKYTPDEDIKVHEEGAIKLLCASFQSHENGLPEWAKNSADEYARCSTNFSERVVVVILGDRSGTRPPSISCLDFSGMTSSAIENHFRNWASPEAAVQGGKAKGVQGGHGNGGKCYMTQMFGEYALLHTVRSGKGNKYGVVGGSIRFGYIPDPDNGRDFDIDGVVKELDKALNHTGCKRDALPQLAQDVLAIAQGFTLVTGVGPKGYRSKIPAEGLVGGLVEHPQMIQTLHLCKIFVVANGKLMNEEQPLAMPTIEPINGEEAPRVIQVPERLKDPADGRKVSTTGDGGFASGNLVLHTSKTSMRWRKKARHSVIFEAQSGYIGYVPVPELDIQSSYRDHIYGLCHLEALEPYKKNERGRLAESRLTRAVERFIAYEIQKYAEEFEIKDKRKYNQKEKNEISRINEALDKWKNRFLDNVMKGMFGTGSDDDPPPPPPLPVGVPKRIELSLSNTRIGRGVSIRPRLRFFDKDGQRIRQVPYRWVSEDPNVALVDEDVNIINSFRYGTTIICAETLERRLRSNRVSLEVVHVRRIRILPEEIEVPVGGRAGFAAFCTLADGTEVKDVSLIWQENDSNVARVSSSGIVFAYAIGQTHVSAGDDCVMAERDALVRVLDEKRAGPGNRRGRGMPKVLVSGPIDRDPDTGEYRHFSSDNPPVWQDVKDVERNIWWINSSAPLAKLYLDRNQGYGYETREWRMYHLERYLDVIVQITLSHRESEYGPMPAKTWILIWGSEVAQIQAAAAADLADFISTGKLPEG